jgi:hypothetical protein
VHDPQSDGHGGWLLMLHRMQLPAVFETGVFETGVFA